VRRDFVSTFPREVVTVISGMISVDAAREDLRNTLCRKTILLRSGAQGSSILLLYKSTVDSLGNR
jgi:hypothetical protein